MLKYIAPIRPKMGEVFQNWGYLLGSSRNKGDRFLEPPIYGNDMYQAGPRTMGPT